MIFGSGGACDRPLPIPLAEWMGDDDPPPIRVLQPRSVPTGRPVMGPVASAVFGVVSGFALVAFFIASGWLLSRLARRYLT